MIPFGADPAEARLAFTILIASIVLWASIRALRPAGKKVARARHSDRAYRETAFLLSQAGEYDHCFHARVAGVAHATAGGTNRQAVIARLQPFEQVFLVREKDHPYDPDAVQVCALRRGTQVEFAPDGARVANLEQFGYLSRAAAMSVVADLDSGDDWIAVVAEITRGGVLGVELLLIHPKPEPSLQLEPVRAATGAAEHKHALEIVR